ncbi:MAG: hypothetical protein Kilf2KO_17590 [Rhodospirillales bacterium]
MSEQDDKGAAQEKAAPPAALDPVALAILELVGQRGAGKSCCPTDVARLLADRRRRAGDPPDLWRRYLQAVREQARHLARQGRIDILRRGQRQDPTAPIKGVIRLSLPSRSDGLSESHG